ncbi:hypothetical protein D3C74_91630 [compost metagenome]
MAPTRTDNDLMRVKLYILLPMILSAFERDKIVAQEKFKTPRPYVSLLDTTIKKVETDLKELRGQLRAAGIKVYEENRSPDGIEARYLCRGYHYDINLRSDLIVAQSTIFMEKYLGLDISKYISSDVPGDDKTYLLPTEIKSH